MAPYALQGCNSAAERDNGAMQFDAPTVDRANRARVYFVDGYWMFQVNGADGKRLIGVGADRELPSVDRLRERSMDWIDWAHAYDLTMELRRVERGQTRPVAAGQR